MRLVILLLVSGLLPACGKHSSHSYGFTNANTVQSDKPTTPADFMKLAIEQGNQDAFQKLLDGGIDVNLRLAQGRTPLIQSTLSGYVLFVHILLQKGADPSLKDDDGKSAMDYAIELQRDRIALLLDPQKQTDLQAQLLQAINEGNDDVSIVTGDLLTAGVDPNFVDVTTGDTPLILAIKGKSLSVMGLITWQDPLGLTSTDVNLPGADGRKPLAVALSLPQNKVMKKIVDALKAANAEE